MPWGSEPGPEERQEGGGDDCREVEPIEHGAHKRGEDGAEYERGGARGKDEKGVDRTEGTPGSVHALEVSDPAALLCVPDDYKGRSL